jgi:hypothetical protein
MRHSQSAAVKRLLRDKNEEKSDELERWRVLGEKIVKLQAQFNQGPAAMAFSFIEGSLIHAIREGIILYQYFALTLPKIKIEMYSFQHNYSFIEQLQFLVIQYKAKTFY